MDQTPSADGEFRVADSVSPWKAIDPRAVDTVDLLTVVRHELGHILGLMDLESSLDDIMSEHLEAGVRRKL